MPSTELGLIPSHQFFQNFITYLYFISTLVRRLQATFGCRYSSMHLGCQRAYCARGCVWEVLRGQNYRPVPLPLGAPKFSKILKFKRNAVELEG